MPRTFNPEHFPTNLQPRMFGIILSSVLHISRSRRAERLRVHFHGNRIRVLVGRLIVLTAGESGLIWLATDADTLQPIEATLTSWRRDTPQSRPSQASGPAYPVYKRPPSINGYYVVGQDPGEKEWGLLRHSHFRYLDRAIESGPGPDPRSAHEPELLDQIVELVGEAIAGALGAGLLRSRLSTPEERGRRLGQAPRQAPRVSTNVTQFVRNPDVVAEALYRAGDTCDLCREKAPFTRLSDGSPYLEVHHCVPLSAGGDDTIENVIALCPTCHRLLHHGVAASVAVGRAQSAWRALYVSPS